MDNPPSIQSSGLPQLLLENKRPWGLLTFHLLDTAQGVLEGVEGGGLAALVPLLGGEVHLELLQSLDQLLLSFGLGGLFATARGVRGKGAQAGQRW